MESPEGGLASRLGIQYFIAIDCNFTGCDQLMTNFNTFADRVMGETRLKLQQAFVEYMRHHGVRQVGFMDDKVLLDALKSSMDKASDVLHKGVIKDGTLILDEDLYDARTKGSSTDN